MRISVLSLFLSAVSSFSLCALNIISKSRLHEIALLDFDTGVMTSRIPLPDLDGVGSISAGAEYGSYYTVTEQNVTEENEFFLVDLNANTTKFVKMIMPPPFANLTRYGISSLNMDSRSKRALALIVGIDVNWSWYCFLGFLNDRTGAIDQVLVDLTDEMRTWTYLYDGITAWDPITGMYYLSAVIGEHDETTILAYNTSNPGPQSPVFTLPYPYDDEGEGMYQSLAISPHLAAQGKGSLVALVDDIDNTAAAIWVTGPPKEKASSPRPPLTRSKQPFRRIPRGSSHPNKKSRRVGSKNTPKRVRDAPAPWNEVIQFEPLTLDMSGENNMILDDKGNAFAVFYDHHTPISNQIVVQVDLVKGTEAARVSVAGSQWGDSIDFLLQCPA